MIGDKASYCPNCGALLGTAFVPDKRGNKLCSTVCRNIYEVKESERIFYTPREDFHTRNKEPPDW